MPVRVLLPNAFQKHTNGAREITSTANNLPALLTEIETTFPDLKTHLRDETGQVRKFINFYVNEEDIRFLGNEKYAFKDGDEVLVIPSIAGGSFTDARSAVVWTASPAPGETPSAPGGRTCRGVCSCCSYCGQEPCCCGD
ncbi:MAG: MoaD/ThiS family protein [Acidobacteriaceae bacterium]